MTVEARFERGERQRTEVVLSGLPDPVIRESRGRLLSALEENRLRLPQGRLLLNLSPAGIRKWLLDTLVSTMPSLPANPGSA